MRRFLSILMLACLLAGAALPVAAEGSPAQLYAQTGETGNFLTNLSFTAGESLSVRFYAGNAADSSVITDAAGFTAQEGLSIAADGSGNCTLSAQNAGTYTLSYLLDETTCSMTVTVTAPAPPPAEETHTIFVTDAEALNAMLSDQEAFDNKLPDSYSGDVTLALPAVDLGSVVCSVSLPGDGVIIFQGAVGTKMKGLTVASTKFRVADVTCSGMSLKVMDGEKTVWNVTIPSGTVNLDGRILQTTVTPLEKAVQINFSSDLVPLSGEGWSLVYSHHGGADKVYVVNDGKLIGRESRFSVAKYGAYFVVEGTPPTVATKDASTKTVTISREHSKYLRRVSIGTGFKAAKVTDGRGGAVYSSCDSDGVVTFDLKPDTADTYTIKEVSTVKTVTTTSRKYTTSQDCFLVTPAGFSNAMRYARENLVTLNCTEAGRKPISLPVASMAAAAEKGFCLLVKTKGAELTLDAAALKSLAQQAGGTTVLLHYRSLNHKTLTTVGQASVRSHLNRYPNDNADLAFLVTATSDSETIEDLQQGTVTLKIPFIVLPGTEGTENRVYALRTESLTEARETTVADGYLTTVLLDLTEHMVFQVGAPAETTAETTEATVETTAQTTQPETEPETSQPTEPAETPNQGGGLIRALLIGLSVMLAAICGVLGLVFLTNRRSRE